MTHGYEFFEYDYIDLDDELAFDKAFSDKVDRKKGKFQKGHIPWNKGMKISIYEGLE